MMISFNAFSDLLLSLADVYAQENREGARDLVALYRKTAPSIKVARNQPYAVMDETILAASKDAQHPAAQAARAAHAVLPWSRTGMLDSQINPSVSSIFAVAHLVGPKALIHSETICAGLFIQCADTFYPAHIHAAEETYAMLSGHAEWQVDLGTFREYGPGALIHHPSYAPHATRTHNHPILAAWRWSGDIRPETYRMSSA